MFCPAGTSVIQANWVNWQGWAVTWSSGPIWEKTRELLVCCWANRQKGNNKNARKSFFMKTRSLFSSGSELVRSQKINVCAWNWVRYDWAMDKRLRQYKSILREALASATDEKLAEMLAFAQDGKMLYESKCSCFIGSLSAHRVHEYDYARDPEHHPYGRCPETGAHFVGHYQLALRKFGLAETAYLGLGVVGPRLADPVSKSRSVDPLDTVRRQRRIVPILKAQIRLRSRQRAFQAQTADRSGIETSDPEAKSFTNPALPANPPDLVLRSDQPPQSFDSVPPPAPGELVAAPAD